MNLQVCLPYQPCWFNCPMCVARGHKHKYIFDNLYASDKKKYLKALKKAVCDLDKGVSVVLTGECDPTQDMNFCSDVVAVVRKYRPDLRIELQTRNYTYRGGLDLDVLSYSVVNEAGYNASSTFYRETKEGAINRMVILLCAWTEKFSNKNFESKGFDQITFKVLQYSEDPDVNKWIRNNKLPDRRLDRIRSIVRPGVSIRLDMNCQSGEGRYLIFRSDGHVYKTWEEGRKEK